MRQPVKGWLNTTVEYIRDEDKLVFQLYWTEIVVVDFKTSSVHVSCGVYNTPTTRRRINQILELLGIPGKVYSKKGAIYSVGDEHWDLPTVIEWRGDTKYWMLFQNNQFKSLAPIVRMQMMAAYNSSLGIV